MRLTARRKSALAVLVALIVASASACSDDKDPSSGPSASTGSSTSGDPTPSGDSSSPSEPAIDYSIPPSELPVTQPISGDVPDGLKVVFLSPGFPEALKYLDGLKAAADVLGWEVSDMTFDFTNPATLTSSMDSAIEQKPDAIVVIPVLREQIAASLAKAEEAGVPIISVLTSDDSDANYFTMLDTKAESAYSATMLAQAISEDSGGSGKVVQLTDPSVNIQATQDDAMKTAFEAECPDCSFDLLTTPIPDVFSGAYVQAVVSYLQRNPDVKYVVSGTGQMGLGLLPALQQAGLNDVKNYGFSPLDVQIEQLAGGAPGAWAAQPPVVSGWAIADEIARVTLKEETGLWNDGTLQYLVSADNAGDIEDPKSVVFPTDYEDEFKALWGK